MSDNSDQDGEGWLTPWEKKCFDEWDKESMLEERTQAECERCEQKIWQSFQNTAAAISHLYKEGSQQSIHLWLPFQSAAGAATILFKDSQEMVRRSFELGSALGSHRRSREVLSWVRKQRRRQLPREDFISYVSGRPAPNRTHRGVPGGVSYSRIVGGTRGSGVESGGMSPRFMSGGGVVGSRVGFYANEPDLTAFKDAVAIQGLSTGRRPSHSSPHRLSSAARPAYTDLGPAHDDLGQSQDDLHSFLVEQFVRHSSNESRKRAASSDGQGGSGSDSPGGNKRSRMETDDY